GGGKGGIGRRAGRAGRAGTAGRAGRREGQERQERCYSGFVLWTRGGRGYTGSVIETYHLSKLYSRGVYALRDLSLTIDKGEFLFLTGPSGAGKSTFLRLLLRQDLPSEGRLRVSGRNLSELTSSQVQSYRRSVGFVFQDFRLIPRFTVFQNVAFVMRVLGVELETQQRKTFPIL